jgi:LysM repeat protein
MPKPMDTPAWPDAKTTPIPPPPPPPSPPITGPMTPAQADSSSGAFLRPIDSARDTAPARPVAAPAQVEMSTYLPVKIQTGDTFKELSKRYYSSDKYDKALEQYNRNHGEASDAMQQEGTLVPGEKAFVPSKTYLEKHYRSAIPDLPAETPATPMPTPEVRGSSVGSQPVRKVVPAYEVAPGGETWQAIAQATLGSPDRSGEIKALNPGITQEMVPAGTLLKLPADAQIQGSGGLR